MGFANKNICTNMDTELIFHMYDIISFYFTYNIGTTIVLHLEYNGMVAEICVLLWIGTKMFQLSDYHNKSHWNDVLELWSYFASICN